MNLKSVLTFIVLTHFVLSCSLNSQGVTVEIQEANKNFMAAIKANDSEKMGQVYTENARLFPTGQNVIEGRGAIEQFWDGIFELEVKKCVLSTVEVKRFGKTAIEEGTYTLFDEKKVVVDNEKYIVIWKKEDGQWKYHKDIWNTNQ